MSKQNTAYNFPLFEPQQREPPGKPGSVIELPSQQLEENRHPKRKSLGLVATFCFMALIVSILGTLAYGQVRLTELTEQLNSATRQMEEQKSLHTQLKMRSDSHMALQAAEVYTRDQLGMSKITYAQVEHIKLSPDSKDRALNPNAADNWWTSVWSSFQDLLS